MLLNEYLLSNCFRGNDFLCATGLSCDKGTCVLLIRSRGLHSYGVSGELNEYVLVWKVDNRVQKNSNNTQPPKVRTPEQYSQNKSVIL